VLTIHHPSGGVRAGRHGPVAEGHAVVVDGGWITAVGPYEKIADEHGGRARVRAWNGVLEPGGYEPAAVALLETVYWPDPREADALGTGPVDASGMAMTDVRWGASARRGVQRLLARGITAVAGPFTRPQAVAAVDRAGVRRIEPGPDADPRQPAARTLEPGAAADFAVFAADGTCLATVLAGRLVYRRA
jgi:hypothetical protein